MILHHDESLHFYYKNNMQTLKNGEKRSMYQYYLLLHLLSMNLLLFSKKGCIDMLYKEV